MQIYTESNIIESHGFGEAQDYHIVNNAHAFKILSSGLYSDKIAAVLREIACNAADAHIAAGTPDLPFEVHLPSRLVPKFYIRDFGPGLSPDEIRSLYTTYFASSKQQSNDFTGAFGLGSKSPFAYTDSFTVISAHDGVETTYFASLGTNGAPTISKVNERPVSDEWPHGLKVAMPVRSGDYHEFQQKAQEIYRWFRVPPNMVSSSPIRPIEYLIDTPEVAILKSHAIGLSVVMGNVNYPVPHAEAHSEGVNCKWATSMHSVLRLPIGAVDVAASRESLEFTPKTRQAIQKALAVATNRVAETYAEKVKQLNFNTIAGIKSAYEWLRPYAVYYIWNWFIELIEDRVPSDVLHRLSTVKYGTIPIPDGTGDIKYAAINRKTGRPTIRKLYNGTVLPGGLEENQAIVLTGNTPYINDRIKHGVTNEYDRLYVVSDDDTKSLAIAKQWYDFPTVKAEDLPLPEGWIPPSKRKKNGRGTRKSKFDTLRPVLMVYIDAQGKVTETDDLIRDVVEDDKKYFITRTVAWGSSRYWIGANSYPYYDGFITQIAKLKPYIPELPNGIAIINSGPLSKYNLQEKYGWKSVSEIRDVLANARSKVYEHNEYVLSHVPANTGFCASYSNPLVFFASHAKSNSEFWLRLKALLPNSPLIKKAEDTAAGKRLISAISADKPIPADVYNSVARYFSHALMVDTTAPVDSSTKNYPTFASSLTYTFPNTLVKSNVKLAAEIVAKLIEVDETNLVDLAA